jgi:hypothetical protein
MAVTITAAATTTATLAILAFPWIMVFVYRHHAVAATCECVRGRFVLHKSNDYL